MDLQRKLAGELRHKEELHPFAVKPWVEAASLEVHPLLAGLSSHLESEEVRKEAALPNIRQMQSQKTIYKDGSAHGGILMGSTVLWSWRETPKPLTS